VSQQRFRLHVFRREQRTRLGDDRFRQPQSAGDGKSVATPGQADGQMISRRESLDVELDGGVLHPVGAECVDLQLRVVGGREHQRALADERVDERLRESGPLHGVGAGAQLVKDDERPFVRLPQNVHDVTHVGRKGGQVLLDGLLIADVRIDARKHRQARAFHGRDVQAGLVHRRQQPDRLQCDGFAARVRSGDEKDGVGRAGVDVDRHDRGRRQERMPRARQVQRVPRRWYRVRCTGHRPFRRSDLGGHPVNVDGVAGLGQRQVDFGKQLYVAGDRVRFLPDQAGQLGQDALHLMPFLDAQYLPTVVEFDG